MDGIAFNPEIEGRADAAGCTAIDQTDSIARTEKPDINNSERHR